MEARKWSINGRFLSQSGTGVQRYASEVVRAIDSLLVEDPSLSHRYTIEIVAPPDAAEPSSLDRIGFRRVGAFGGHLWEQTVLPRHASGGLLSLCNTGPVRHKRHIVCIHDLNTRLCPQSYSRSFRAVYRVLLPALGRSCKAVATVSHFSAGELERLGICAAEKIVVVPNGHEHAKLWRPEHSAKTLGKISHDTIAMIGSPAPHKNTGLLLGLADRLLEAGLGLVVVGAADRRVFRADTKGAARNVHFLGRVDDAELAAVLRDCLCLAFPSITEGFGLPPLEAMALGCPVVVSNRASLPEVCGEAALYASPDDPSAWLQHFAHLRRSPDARAALVADGLARSARFSWRTAAQTYLDAMRCADRAARGKTVEPQATSPSYACR